MSMRARFERCWQEQACRPSPDPTSPSMLCTYLISVMMLYAACSRSLGLPAVIMAVLHAAGLSTGSSTIDLMKHVRGLEPHQVKTLLGSWIAAQAAHGTGHIVLQVWATASPRHARCHPLLLVPGAFPPLLCPNMTAIV